MDLSFNGGDESIERGEILVMGSEAAQQFPNAFDGIEFGAIRWKEIQPK